MTIKRQTTKLTNKQFTKRKKKYQTQILLKKTYKIQKHGGKTDKTQKKSKHNN